MNERPKQRWGVLQWGVVASVVVLLASLLWAASSGMHICTRQMHGVSDCKQIIMALKQFSKDYGSSYPDIGTEKFTPLSSNQVFRRLIQEDIVVDERIFGCPGSKYFSDGNIGDAPEFKKAIGPGECHWMMLKGQSETSVGKIPIIFENALAASWPPKWDIAAHDKPGRGRAWRGGQIIVGRNDGSVAVESLKADGTLDWHSKPNLTAEGRSWLDWLGKDAANLSLWDIEEK